MQYILLIPVPPQMYQIENAKLRAEIRSLKGTSRTSGPVSSASSIVPAGQDEDNSLHLEYRGLGKRFAILSELWMRPSLLKQPCPSYLQTLGPWHSRRCADDAAWDDGIISELYFLLPGPYHELIESSPLFSDQVCTNCPKLLS
jgi:hypothetical protein